MTLEKLNNTNEEGNFTYPIPILGIPNDCWYCFGNPKKKIEKKSQ
jgi:hypothetical protein